jgi:hypothetical protein
MGPKPRTTVLARASRYLLDCTEKLLSQLRVAVMRSEELLVENGDSSRTQKKVNARRWKPPPSNGR